MSLIQDLNDLPGGDKFQELYDKFNANNAWYVRTGLPGLTVSGNNLTLHREGGASETVALPVGGDRIISGLVVTITGTGPYTVNVAPGQWSIAGTTYTLSSPLSTPLTAPDPTLDRIDAVFATNAGTVIYVAGVASATPAAPVAGPGQLLVNYISVPATGMPGPTPPVLVLPPGTRDGQVLLWDEPTNSWTVFHQALINSLTAGAYNTLFQFPGAPLNRFQMNQDASFNATAVLLARAASASGYNNILSMDNTQILLRRANAGAGMEASLALRDSFVELRAFGTNKYIELTSSAGIRIGNIPAPPVITSEKLYSVGGTLFWAGNQICTAPCGGGSIQNIKYILPGPHTIVPAAGATEIIVKVNVGDPVTINLPASPANNLKVTIKAVANQNASSNPILISATPNTIDNLFNTTLLDTSSGSLTLIWNSDGLDSTWLII